MDSVYGQRLVLPNMDGYYAAIKQAVDWFKKILEVELSKSGFLVRVTHQKRMRLEAFESRNYIAPFLCKGHPRPFPGA